MIFIQAIESSPENKKIKSQRDWGIFCTDDNGNFKGCLTKLNLVQSSITNKFDVVVKLIEEMCSDIPEFDSWIENLLVSYIESEYNSEIILEQCDKMIEFVNKYIDLKKINFSNFIDRTRTTKTSIIFDENDLRNIAVSSTCLKIYSIFWCDEIMKPSENIHKKIYDKIIEPCVQLETTTKIFQLIRSRIYGSTMTNKYVWDLIRITVLEDQSTYIMSIFNFVMKNLISILDVEKNPVPFLRSTVDDSIQWLMCTVYKDKILYTETVTNSEDIYGTSLSKDSFHMMCCKDVIYKAASLGIDLLEKEYGLSIEEFGKARKRIEDVNQLYPHMKLVTMPIASNVLEVPYKYLLATSPKHIIGIGILMYYLSNNIFKEEFSIIRSLMVMTSNDIFKLNTKSVYKIKNAHFILDETRPIFGFNSYTLKLNIISSICGVLSSARKSLVYVFNGKRLNKLSYKDLEESVSKFYVSLYGGGLKKSFSLMREKMDELL